MDGNYVIINNVLSTVCHCLCGISLDAWAWLDSTGMIVSQTHCNVSGSVERHNEDVSQVGNARSFFFASYCVIALRVVSWVAKIIATTSLNTLILNLSLPEWPARLSIQVCKCNVPRKTVNHKSGLTSSPLPRMCALRVYTGTTQFHYSNGSRYAEKHNLFHGAWKRGEKIQNGGAWMGWF